MKNIAVLLMLLVCASHAVVEKDGIVTVIRHGEGAHHLIVIFSGGEQFIFDEKLLNTSAMAILFLSLAHHSVATIVCDEQNNILFARSI
jgi:hypothetical protein